ncbi:MAG: hypothetical protein IPJ65_06695, partial [Archangiaceae bacterium]|nr:hypothetical protein [Archangiaceae bacterium]
ACGDLDLPDGGHVDGFSGNTCPYASGQWNNASPSTEFFAVTANGACFDYFSNPASSDYAKKGLWLHELGHSTGMVHSKNWPAADLKYISTMQGKLEFSSAYDVAFLRQNYPLAWPGAWRNFVASSKIRLDFGGPNEVSDAFAEENPAGIYLVGDEVYDCRTKQKAVWYAAWFNQGLDVQEPDHCMINQLRIESPATVREVVLKTIHAAPMPKESQDQWTGPAVVTAADFTGFPRGAQVDLVFEVNVYEQWRERNWDNIVRAPITLYSSSACMASVPATETAPIRLTSMGHYDIDRSYLNRLGASPEMMRRDVRLVPTKVGANVRYRVRSLDAAGIGASLGLKADDVLSTVDAQPVGPTTLQQGYLKLVSAGRLTVVVLRNGAPLTLHYRVV